MSDTLYITLYDGEDFRLDYIKRAISSYWIDKLLLDDDGMKLSRYTAIGLSKKVQRIKDYINNGILTFAPYKKALLIRFSLCTAEKEIESISIEDNQFVIKFKQS
ncbi:hypothetical protein I6E23_12410 [Prevotella brevis]|nr:hypothetical protein [Xylanibacter brevis]